MITLFKIGRESEPSLLIGINNFLVLADGTFLSTHFFDVKTIPAADGRRKFLIPVS
jgi:hypothetical protein